MDSVHIDGHGPLPVRRPSDVAELSTLVREARAERLGIYSIGGKTLLDLGLPPTKPGFAVDTTGLNRVIDYPARDMTVTVQAGITRSELSRVLATEGQWLPVDAPFPDRATLGGSVATNVSGPRRWGHGTLRDYVIGIKFVSDDGAEVKGGGRVVKNVAGYDLMKLQTGALGTLGVITEVTLKVKPKPEATAAVSFKLDVVDLGPVLDLLHGSASRPVAVELSNAGGWTVTAGFEEKASTVEWQVNALLDELKKTKVRDVQTVRDPNVWQAATDMQVRAESTHIWKASVLPSQTAAYLQKLPADALIHTQPLNGIVWVHHAGPVPGATLRRGSNKTSAAVWGDPARSDFALMKHMKQTLDPQDVFNPGRMFGTL